MQVLLIRHGNRERTEPDAESSLSSKGRKQASELATLLDSLASHCQVFLSSTHVHAKETADILKPSSTSHVVYELSALTPHSPTETLEQIVDEAKTRGVSLENQKCVAIVGHEPRLGQLFTRLTSKRIGPLDECELICVSGEWLDLNRGNGKFEFRIPVKPPDSQALAEKVHGKMEAAVFLAGFTIPALVELVKSEDATVSLSRGISAFFFTLSLAFFVVAVYVYDELAMPEGFWSARAKSRHRPRQGKFAKNWQRFGPVYAYMIRTWTRVFTPALVFSGLGFLNLFWNTCIQVTRLEVGLMCLAAILLGVLNYIHARPRLAVD